MPFQVGDRVRCVESSGELVRDEEYVVSRVLEHNGLIRLEGLGREYFSRRFVLVDIAPAVVHNTREFVHWVVYYEILTRQDESRFQFAMKHTEREAEGTIEAILATPETYRLLGKKKIKVNIPI